MRVVVHPARERLPRNARPLGDFVLGQIGVLARRQHRALKSFGVAGSKAHLSDKRSERAVGNELGRPPRSPTGRPLNALR